MAVPAVRSGFGFRATLRALADFPPAQRYPESRAVGFPPEPFDGFWLGFDHRFRNDGAMLRFFLAIPLSIFVTILSASAADQKATPSDPVESRIRAAIAAIRAIDNHAHPLALTSPGAPDLEFDQLVSPLADFPLPVRLRPDNPEIIRAWQALYGYPYDDASDAHVAEMKTRREKIVAQQGDHYSAWILDQIGTETLLANRVAMGRGLMAPRFRWVAFVDSLAMPFRHAALAEETPDRGVYFGDVEKLAQRYLKEAGLTAWPATLDEYLHTVVTATVERMKKSGAIGIKFEAAYLRSLAFNRVPQTEAAGLYAAGVKQPLTAAEDTRLQDFLYHYLAQEAGRLELPVQIHVGPGIGGHVLQLGAHPQLLEPLLEDPAASRTKFVLLHGAWPYAGEVAALLSKPNVYTDFSAQTFLLYPPALAKHLREWLAFLPDKVLFGTDALPPGPDAGWEEMAWMTAATGREALTLAILGMIKDGEVTEERGLAIARAVLRENAISVYGQTLEAK
jgi:hypothetical protein